MRARFAILAAAALSLGGCAYGDLGVGMGYGDPYGYGYGPYGGYGYGYDPYGYGYGYGYGSPYYGGYYGSPFGWYDNYYYPGTGYYVYDTYRRPTVWTDSQRRYWTQRVQRYRSTSGTTTTVTKPDWSGFTHRGEGRSSDWQANRDQRIQDWQQRQSERLEAQTERSQGHAEARVERQSSKHGHHGNGNDDND